MCAKQKDVKTLRHPRHPILQIASRCLRVSQGTTPQDHYLICRQVSRFSTCWQGVLCVLAFLHLFFLHTCAMCHIVVS